MENFLTYKVTNHKIKDKQKNKSFLKLDTGESVELIEEKEELNKKDNGKFISVLSLAWNLGFSIAIPVVGGGLLGQFLDNKFNCSPKMTLSLIFTGVIVGITNIYFFLKKID
jgi:predicted F0F1-ATPase subunit